MKRCGVRKSLGTENHQGVKGFTLLELLLSFTILGIILVTVYSSLRIGLNAWEASKRRIDTLQEARIALMRITSGINGLYRPERGSKIIPLEIDNSTFHDYPGDELRIVAFSHARPHDRYPRGGLRDVTFYLEREAGKRTGKIVQLETRGYTKEGEMKELRQEDEGVIYTEIAHNIMGLNFRFFDGEQWNEEWDFEKEKTLPGAVEVAITFLSGKEPKLFYTAVEIPFRRGEEEEKHVPMEERGRE